MANMDMYPRMEITVKCIRCQFAKKLCVVDAQFPGKQNVKVWMDCPYITVSARHPELSTLNEMPWKLNCAGKKHQQ